MIASPRLVSLLIQMTHSFAVEHKIAQRKTCFRFRASKLDKAKKEAINRASTTYWAFTWHLAKGLDSWLPWQS